MNKFEYDQEADRLYKAAERLLESDQLGYDTAVFLDKEAKKLESIINDENTTDEDREIAIKKLEILQNKILGEINHVQDNDTEMTKIECALSELVTGGYDE